MDPAERLRLLLAPVHERALAFARCLCRSRADGDDVFQDALVRALTKLHHLRDDRAFRPWLYRVIVTVHRSRYRRSFWRRFLPLPDPERVPEPVSEEPLGGEQRIRRALEILPPEQREALVLFELEGWKVEEIAELQDVSVSAVKSRLARGRQRLRGFYEQQLLLAEAQVPRLAPASMGEVR